jgi:hypothetical protein
MRKFIFLLFLVPFLVSGQNYFKDGTEWNYYESDTDYNSELSYKTAILSGDTVVGGKEAFKLYTMKTGNEATKQYQAAIRKDAEKVYFSFPSDNGEWWLMYDFGLQVGDTCTVRCFYESAVQAYLFKCVGYENVDEYGGCEAIRVALADVEEDSSQFFTGLWIKGVGSNEGVVFNCHFGVTGLVAKLLSVYSDSQMVLNISQNGVSDVVGGDVVVNVAGDIMTIANVHRPVYVEVYRADGVQVKALTMTAGASLQLPAPGLYLVVVDGKTYKIVGR